MAQEIGDAVSAVITVTDRNGSPSDPTLLTVKYKKPDASVITKQWPIDPEVDKDSAGHFHIDLNLNMSGTWIIYADATGAVQASSPEVSISVVAHTF